MWLIDFELFAHQPDGVMDQWPIYLDTLKLRLTCEATLSLSLSATAPQAQATEL